MEQVAARPCITCVDAKGRKWPFGSLVLGSSDRKGYGGVWDAYSHGKLFVRSAECVDKDSIMQELLGGKHLVTAH
jgi:hypothetical protein